MNINAYATLVEKSNSKGIKALMAKRKLKKATCEMSHNSSYAREFEGLYVENVQKCGYKTTIFIGLDSDSFGTPGFQEWAEKLWSNTCSSEFRYVWNFDWTFKMPEHMIVFCNYNHRESSLAERSQAHQIMRARIEEHIGKNFSVELFGSDMLKVSLK